MNTNYIDKINELVDKYPVEIVFDNILCDFNFAVLGSKPDAKRVPILQSNKNSNFKDATMPERWRDDGCYGQVTLWDLSDDEIKQIYLQIFFDKAEKTNHIVVSGYGLAGIIEKTNNTEINYYAYLGAFRRNETYTTIVSITKEEFDEIKLRYQNQIKAFYDTKPYKIKLFSDKEKQEWKNNFIKNHIIVAEGWGIL